MLQFLHFRAKKKIHTESETTFYLNKKKDINIFLDASMFGKDTIFCHPLVNDKTISLSYNSLLIYFDYLGLSFETVNLSF